MNQFPRRLAMIAATVMSLVYLVFRGLYTLNLDGWFAASFSVTLYAAEWYGCLLMYLYFFQIWDLQEPEPVDPIPGRTVDVFIPTYNEDPDLLRGTITAALAMDYPHRTIVLDDGRRPEMAALCEELGCEYLTRDSNLHAKAGNLNHAMELTDGEFVIVFDADHVAERNFITRIVGYFADDDLAFVQTPHAFYNFDNFQGVLDYGKGVYWEEGQLFYNCTQPGKNAWNAVSFCGSAAMFRRAALETVGLIATESITEDLHTGMRLHAKGWKSLFVNDRLVAGQAAGDITTFHSQRLRWGEGNLGVMFFDNPFTMPGLTLAQRLCYIGSMLCWTTGVQKLILYYAPILMLLTGVAPVGSLTPTLVAITATYLATVWYGVKVSSNGFGKLLAIELTQMACFWTQIRSTWRAFFGRAAAKFIVTAKRGRQTDSTLRELKPQLIYLAASAGAAAWAGGRLLYGVSEDYVGFLIGGLLVAVNCGFAFTVVRRTLKQNDRRFSWRHPLAAHLAWSVPVGDGVGGELTADGEFDDRDRIEGQAVTRDLNERGVGFVTFEELPGVHVGSVIDLTVTAAGRTVHVAGEVRNKACLADRSSHKGTARVWRYGVRFAEPATGALTDLWAIGAKYAVGRQYERFHTGHGLGEQDPAPCLDGERTYHLPVTLTRDGTPVGVAVTETLGIDTCSVLLPAARAAGEVLELTLDTPGGAAVAWASVESAEPVVAGGAPLVLHRLRFRKFAGQSRGTLQTVHTFGESPELAPVVALKPRQLPQPLARPAAALGGVLGTAAAAVLAVSFWANHDDYLMIRTARGYAVADATVNRLDELLLATRAADEFDETRILRLRDAFTELGRADAVGELNELLVEGRPATPVGRFRRGETLMNLGRTAEAEEILTDLLADLSVFPVEQTRREVWLAAARLAANEGRWDDAAARFTGYETSGGSLRGLRAEYAGVLARAGRPEDGLRVLTETGGWTRGELFGPTREERHLTASLQVRLERFDEASLTLRDLLEDDPTDADAARGLAEVALGRGDAAAAVAAYRKFLKAHPDDPSARLGLARALLAAGERDGAAPLVLEMLADHPDDPELWDALLWAVSDGPAPGPREAAAVAAIADRRDARVADVTRRGDFLLSLAAALDRTGDEPRLGAVRRDFVGLPAATPERRFRRAVVLADLGRHAEAGREFSVLVRDAGSFPADTLRRDLLLAAARNSAALGRFAEAAERFDALVASGTPAADLREERAGVLASARRTAEAIALLSEYADPPLSPTERRLLAGLHAAAGDAENALRLFAELSDDAPGATGPLRDLAEAQLAADDFAAAADTLGRVLDLDPADRDARERLGSALLWDGKAVEAEATLRELVAADRAADPPVTTAWLPYLNAAAELRADGELDRNAERTVAAIHEGRRLRPNDADLRLALIDALTGDGGTVRASDAGRLDAVRAEFVALPAVTPERRLRRAEVLTDLDRHADAAPALDVLLAEDLFADTDTDADGASRRRDLLRLAARNAARLDRDAVAADRFAELVSAGEPVEAVRAEWAGVLARAGRVDEALDLLPEDAAPPLTPGERRLLASVHGAAKDFAAAGRVLDTLAAEFPGDAAVARERGELALAAGEFADAATAFRQALALDADDRNPDGVTTRERLGLSLLWAEDYAAAEPVLRDVVVADLAAAEPTGGAWTAYLNAAASLGGPDSADPAVARTVARVADRRDVRPADAALRAALIAALSDGPAAARAEDADRLAAVRAEYVALPPADAEGRLRRAAVLADLGRHDAAAADLDALLAGDAFAGAADVRRRDLLRTAARTAADRGRLAATAGRDGDARERYAAAADRFGRLAALGEPQGEVRDEWAGVLARLGRPDEALRHLPEHADPPLTAGERRLLASLFSTAERFGDADRVLAGLLTEFPEDAAVARELGEVRLARDDFAGAAAAFRRSYDLDPAARNADGVPTRVRLGYALLWAEQFAAAEAALRGPVGGSLDEQTPDLELWTAYLRAASESAPTVAVVGSADGERRLRRDAAELVLAMHRRSGEFADPDFLLALVAAADRTGRRGLTVPLLARLTRRDPVPRELVTWLADTLQAEGRYEEAEGYYRLLLGTSGPLPAASLPPINEFNGGRRAGAGVPAGL